MRFGLLCTAQATTALARQADLNQRTVDVSRQAGRAGGSHVLAYADEAGGTERHALFGTPDEVCVQLAALHDVGAEYILLTILGGTEQLRRFGRDIMPAFSQGVNR
ncbi:MAG: flavin-dependent oxidoreductase, F420-dependent methylene-tetrahydromethanopterin reductase [Actinomycetia bacterium]|nr:flavin-dependent oxidoreductase, F420-dependent methylene-tetrahydromethanopterin reductase [Actinomycetes bacterium]